jgi:hypothetical protein
MSSNSSYYGYLRRSAAQRGGPRDAHLRSSSAKST